MLKGIGVIVPDPLVTLIILAVTNAALAAWPSPFIKLNGKPITLLCVTLSGKSVDWKLESIKPSPCEFTKDFQIDFLL